MKTLRVTLFSLVVILTIFTFSCSKENDGCFDEQLYREHKDDICLMNCPGVIGCDGNEYCNECIANSKGIHVKK